MAVKTFSEEEVGPFAKRCREDPFFWIQEALGHGYLTPEQKMLIESYRDHKRTAVPAGHMNGRTFAFALCAMHFLYTHTPSRVITTAPTKAQVKDQMWKEIAVLWARARVPLGGRLLQTRLELSDKWFAVGMTTNNPAAFQGSHEASVCVIGDEATGIPPFVFEVIETITGGPADKLVVGGNPTDPSGDFKRICDSPNWNVVRLNSENHPNVIEDSMIVPGAVTKEWIRERLIDYGGRETPLYRARVLGLFPEQGSDMLISLKTVEDAQEKWRDPRDSRITETGTDVARFGADETVLFPMHENGTPGFPMARTGQNLMATVGWIVSMRADRNAIDDTGVGGGVTDRLNEISSERGRASIPVDAINFGEKAENEERFVNRRSELWWNAREWLLAGGTLPPDSPDFTEEERHGAKRLAADLTNVKYSYDSKGRIKLEPKEDVKKRLGAGRSPDYGDAFVLALYAHRAGKMALVDMDPAKEAVFAKGIKRAIFADEGEFQSGYNATRGEEW